jgi:hypothetical protein
MSLGFNSHKDKYTRKIKVVKDFTNAIFFGRTGTGKTTGAILPTIEDRIKSGYGLLIYDFKGNLHLQTKYLANKFDRLNDVVEIGKPWGKNINILKYLTTKQFLQIVQSNTQARIDFWDIASRNLLEGIYSVLKLDKYIFTQINKLVDKEYKNEISLKQIHKILSKPTNLKKFLEDYKNSKLEFIDSEYQKVLNKTQNLNLLNTISKKIEELKENLELLSNYELVNDEEDAGRNGVVSHLASYTINGASNEFLNKDEFDIVNGLRDGKIVIIDVSNLTENSLNLINLGIYSSLQRINEKTLKPVSIIIDEAQKILHKDYLPETDVCRESRFEYIFATQSEVLLINKLSSDKFDELIANIATRCSFATNTNDLEEIHEYIDTNYRTYFCEPLFINEKDLFNTEVIYQKNIDLLDYIEEDTNNCFYLKFDAKLFEENKVYKVFEDGKKLEVDFYEKDNYVPIVAIEEENIEQYIDTLVKEITLQDFKIQEKKQIHALAYAIGIMDDKISENEKSIAQLRVEKEEIRKEFATLLKSINNYKKVYN